MRQAPWQRIGSLLEHTAHNSKAHHLRFRGRDFHERTCGLGMGCGIGGSMPLGLANESFRLRVEDLLRCLSAGVAPNQQKWCFVSEAIAWPFWPSPASNARHLSCAFGGWQGPMSDSPLQKVGKHRLYETWAPTCLLITPVSPTYFPSTPSST